MSVNKRTVGVLLAGLICLSSWAQQLPRVAATTASLAGSDASGEPAAAVVATKGSSTTLVPIAFRGGRGRFFSHRWLEVQTSTGEVTLGFGSALLPFIDRGQITVEDNQGREQHKFFPHIPLYLDFGRSPGSGREIAPTVYVPVSRADQIVEQQRHRRFLFPYIPLIHDCRTYVCAMQASIAGKSKLPCYVLFKGYW